MLHLLLADIIGLRPDTSPAVQDAAQAVASRLTIFEGYIGVCIAAFLVALVTTPILRRFAVANGVIDTPKDPRKVHRVPVAYLGGVGIYIGIMAGVFYSVIATRFPVLMDFHQTKHLSIDGSFHFPVPISVMLGMTVIVVVGVIDDMVGISPRVKIGGQLFAAAALAIEDIGVRLASGIVLPICKGLHIPTSLTSTGIETLALHIPVPFVESGSIPIDIIYWLGTALIGLSVVGLCNAANLLDGLDGLLSGTTAISTIGLLVIALGMAVLDDGKLDGQRIILCMAVIGACLGFLPHNFSPASIFLGDAGSLLLGFVVCVIILTLGDTGKTHLVAAGLICFLLPVLDTMLAIIRRKMEGKSISAADDQHIHHMLRRALGVRGAVLTLYAIAAAFAATGAMMALSRARTVYLIAMVLVSYIGVTAIKIARRKHIENAAMVGAATGVLSVNEQPGVAARRTPGDRPDAKPSPSVEAGPATELAGAAGR